MNSHFNIQTIKEQLLRTAEYCQAIEVDTEFFAEDLMLRSPEFMIKEIISTVLDEAGEDVEVNSLNIKIPTLPSSDLKSFVTYLGVSKDVTVEKNGLSVKIPESTGNDLSSDTILVTFTFYHPVHKFKTQEWVLRADNTFEDLHSSVQCLANFFEFGVKSDKVIFRIGEHNVKNLKLEIQEIPLKIGEICTYLHKGVCQHDMIISDIRLISRFDPQSVQHYPFALFSSKLKRRTCEVCTKSHAKFIVLKNAILDLPYIYLCETCLKLLDTSSSEIYPYLYD